MYSWIVQWTTEIPTNAPYGEDITFSEDFDAIRLEVDKATSIHAEAPTDWGKVLERCSAMLAETSKDLWLFWYGCRAAFEVYGSAGLVAALETCAEYLQEHWQGLFPPKTKPARRAAPFAWFITHMEFILNREFLNSLPENECQNLRASFTSIQALIDKELDDQAPSFRLFIRALPEPEVTMADAQDMPDTTDAFHSPDEPGSAVLSLASSGTSQKSSKGAKNKNRTDSAKNSDDKRVADKNATSKSATGIAATGKTTTGKAGTTDITPTRTARPQPSGKQQSGHEEIANPPDNGKGSARLKGEGSIGQQGAGSEGSAIQQKGQGEASQANASAASSGPSETTSQTNPAQGFMADKDISPVHRESTRAMELPSPAPLFPQHVPTMSEASLTQLIRNTAEQTRQLAGYFLALNPLDWKAYVLHRAVLWGSIIQLPDAANGGLTQIRPPSKERLQEYSSAMLNNQYAGVLLALEKTASHAPFWLDGHGMVIKCLNALQAPMAAQVLTACLRCFIDKFPQLLGYQFFDGTPFASQETHDWLSTLDAPAKNAVPSLMSMPLGTEQGTSKTREQIAEALDVVKAKGFHEGFRCFDSLPLSKSRQGLLNALTKVNFCLMAGKPEAALTLATVTYKQLEDWGMAEWEPELSAQLLGLIIKSPGLPADKRNELYQKLHWIHMETALGLMPE